MGQLPFAGMTGSGSCGRRLQTPLQPRSAPGSPRVVTQVAAADDRPESGGAGPASARG